MKLWLVPTFRGIVLCGLVATLPALAQDNGQHGNGHSAPGGQAGGHPSGQHGAPDGGAAHPQPARPSPAQGAARPNPGGGHQNTGGGNAGHQQPHPTQRPTPHPQPARPRPQPSHPTPHPQPGRPSAGHGGGNSGHGGSRPPSHGRPTNWGHAPAQRPHWNFRPDNRSYLHTYYLRMLGSINRATRPRFAVGGYFPYEDIGYLQPLSPDVYAQMPPPPPGYQMGYYDGYVVTYDPMTGYILDVVDLLQ